MPTAQPTLQPLVEPQSHRLTMQPSPCALRAPEQFLSLSYPLASGDEEEVYQLVEPLAHGAFSNVVTCHLRTVG